MKKRKNIVKNIIAARFWTCVNKYLHIHQIADSLVMENQNTFQDDNIRCIYLVQTNDEFSEKLYQRIGPTPSRKKNKWTLGKRCQHLSKTIYTPLMSFKIINWDMVRLATLKLLDAIYKLLGVKRI